MKITGYKLQLCDSPKVYVYPMGYRYQRHIPKSFFIFLSQPMYHQYHIGSSTNIMNNHKYYLCVSMNFSSDNV